MLVNGVPQATLSKMRELTKPMADKFAASYDPALVQLYRSEPAKVQASIQ